MLLKYEGPLGLIGGPYLIDGYPKYLLNTHESIYGSP